MKTKELIRLLQLEDPSGELECVVGGCDIHFVDAAPGYWDGPYEVLVRDENKSCYNIIGGKFTTEGTKINIRRHSIEDAIFSNPDISIEIEYGYSDKSREEYLRKNIESWREQSKQIHKENNEHFEKFLEEKFQLYIDNPSVEILEKEFGGWLNQPKPFGPRKDVVRFLDKMARKYVDMKLDEWICSKLKDKDD